MSKDADWLGISDRRWPWISALAGGVAAILILLLAGCGVAPDQSNAADDEPIVTTPPSSH